MLNECMKDGRSGFCLPQHRRLLILSRLLFLPCCKGECRQGVSPLPTPSSQGSQMYPAFSDARTFSDSCFLVCHNPTIPKVPESIPAQPAPPQPHGMCGSVDHVNSPHQQGCHCPLVHSVQMGTEPLCAGRISCARVALSLNNPSSAPFCPVIHSLFHDPLPDLCLYLFIFIRIKYT